MQGSSARTGLNICLRAALVLSVMVCSEAFHVPGLFGKSAALRSSDQPAKRTMLSALHLKPAAPLFPVLNQFRQSFLPWQRPGSALSFSFNIPLKAAKKQSEEPLDEPDDEEPPEVAIYI